MASIRPEKGKWRVFIAKKGVRRTRTFQSKAMAEVWANRTEAEIEAESLGEIHQYKTFGDALDRYFEEVSPHKKSYRWEKIRYNALKKLPFCNVLLKHFNASHVAEYRDTRLNQVQSSTVNRELNFISAIFTRAMKEWQWVKANPVLMIKRPSNPRHRDRRISEEEISALLHQLGYKEGSKPHSKSAEIGFLLLIALETALRKGELLSLKWNDVYLSQRFVTVRNSKNGDTRDVPLSIRAVELLTVLQSGDEGFVFSVLPGTADTLFRKAVKRAGIENLHFHDSRHEAISRLARKLDVLDLARMVGHRDPRSLMVYYNATASEIASRLD